MKTIERKKKQNAPQLVHGWRDKLYGRLPHYIKDGLREIARQENKSMTWVVEETIIRYFKLKRPMYKERKRTSNVN